MIDEKRLQDEMVKIYNEKVGKISDTLAEGFMQVDTLISHQPKVKIEFNKLLELVDKNTPKYIKCPKGYQGTRYTRFYCPTCGKMLELGEYAFCKHCGQALKYPKLEKIDDKLVYVYKDGE